MSDARGEAAAAFVRSRGFDGRFDCALVLGTGLGVLGDDLDDVVVLPYADIPGFPRAVASGHAGRLLAGHYAGKRLVVLQGRAHYYDRGDAAAMRVPIALVRELGSPPLVLTNAAGSTRAEIRPGVLALVADHLNLAGANPLFGEAGDARFVAMTAAYDPTLRDALKRAAAVARVPLADGVYAWFSGPSFETPAEVAMARTLGADLVGMSTVPEVILARYYGLRVAAVSVVTNLAAGVGAAAPSHEETKTVATAAAADLRRLLAMFLAHGIGERRH